jgi:DNA-binding MarR family transcriptional regulator
MKSMTAPEPFATLDLDAFMPYLVNVLARRFSTELAMVYQARFGISIAEWRVIAHLAQNKKVSVREIYARVAMDKSKVSRAAARLEDAGIVEKKTGAADRRLVELQLTRKGRRLYGEIVPLALTYEQESLSPLSLRERGLFRALVGKLLNRAAAHGIENRAGR